MKTVWKPCFTLLSASPAVNAAPRIVAELHQFCRREGTVDDILSSPSAASKTLALLRKRLRLRLRFSEYRSFNFRKRKRKRKRSR